MKPKDKDTKIAESAEPVTPEMPEQGAETAAPEAVVAIGFRDKMKPILSEKFPDKNLDDDGEYESAMDEYHGSLTSEIGKYKESNSKLAEKFAENPVIASFLSDVFGGEDVVASLIRHFGEDVAAAANDPEKIDAITKEVTSRSDKMKQEAETKAEQEANWNKSLAEIEAYQKESGKSPDEMDALFDAIMQLHTNGIMGIFTKDDLVKYDKMINYDNDIEEAQLIGEAKGRNQKIEMNKEKFETAPLPDMAGTSNTDIPVEDKKYGALESLGKRVSLRDRGKVNLGSARKY